MFVTNYFFLFFFPYSSFPHRYTTSFFVSIVDHRFTWVSGSFDNPFSALHFYTSSPLFISTFASSTAATCRFSTISSFLARNVMFFKFVTPSSVSTCLYSSFISRVNSTSSFYFSILSSSFTKYWLAKPTPAEYATGKEWSIRHLPSTNTLNDSLIIAHICAAGMRGP